jgi:deazaflavin-dependent oxidoreductase (nitroreductase family)
VVHRAVFSLTRGRVGLRNATTEQWGMLRLRTIGRRTGEERRAILGYLNDGPNLVLLATNGMDEPPPAWCLNLQAQPDAWVDLPDGSLAVRARTAEGDERSRLWALWVAQGDELDAHAAARSREIPVVVLEPRSDDGR